MGARRNVRKGGGGAGQAQNNHHGENVAKRPRYGEKVAKRHQYRKKNYLISQGGGATVYSCHLPPPPLRTPMYQALLHSIFILSVSY